MKYRVDVTEYRTTNGWYYVEADSEFEAFEKALSARDNYELEADAEWGGCEDLTEYFVNEYIEEVDEPTVSEGLWNE